MAVHRVGSSLIIDDGGTAPGMPPRATFPLDAGGNHPAPLLESIGDGVRGNVSTDDVGNRDGSTRGEGARGRRIRRDGARSGRESKDSGRGGSTGRDSIDRGDVVLGEGPHTGGRRRGRSSRGSSGDYHMDYHRPTRHSVGSGDGAGLSPPSSPKAPAPKNRVYVYDPVSQETFIGTGGGGHTGVGGDAPSSEMHGLGTPPGSPRRMQTPPESPESPRRAGREEWVAAVPQAASGASRLGRWIYNPNTGETNLEDSTMEVHEDYAQLRQYGQQDGRQDGRQGWRQDGRQDWRQNGRSHDSHGSQGESRRSESATSYVPNGCNTGSTASVQYDGVYGSRYNGHRGSAGSAGSVGSAGSTRPVRSARPAVGGAANLTPPTWITESAAQRGVELFADHSTATPRSPQGYNAGGAGGGSFPSRGGRGGRGERGGNQGTVPNARYDETKEGEAAAGPVPPSGSSFFDSTQSTAIPWRFHGYNMIMGSRLVVLKKNKAGHMGRVDGTDGEFTETNRSSLVTLKFHDTEKPFTSEHSLDHYLDNVFARVPTLALCLHRRGVVQGYRLVKTEDIPRLRLTTPSLEGPAHFDPQVRFFLAFFLVMQMRAVFVICTQPD